MSRSLLLLCIFLSFTNVLQAFGRNLSKKSISFTATTISSLILPFDKDPPEVGGGKVKDSANASSVGSTSFVPTGSPADISYFLYTKQKPTEPVEITVGDYGALKSSGFIANAPVKLLTHGWMGGYNSSFPQDMKNAYLGNFIEGDINVITTDWSPLSKDSNYFKSASNVPLVAKSNFRLISFLLLSNMTKIGDFHLVGHSLGAHISGITGQNIQKQLNLTIPRISGLDPAKPVFSFVPKDQRIDRTDANFVDIIHSAGHSAGIYRTLGHVDFYPNGGVAQEGCNLNPACSHSRSHQYFTESISNPRAFAACPCPRPDFALNFGGTDEYSPLLLDCPCIPASANETLHVHMGQHVPEKTTGVFYLRTYPGSPYSKSR